MVTRVLFVDDSVGFGGASISLAQVVPALDGVEATIASRLPKSITGALFPGQLILQIRSRLNYVTRGRFNRTMHRFLPETPARIAGKGYGAADLLYTIGCAYALSRTVRGMAVDVVHCNNNLTLLAYYVARFLGVPLVCHFRGADNYLDWPRHVVEYPKRFVSVSRALIQHYEQYYPVPLHNVTAIPNPVALEPFVSLSEEVVSGVRERYGIPQGGVVAGMVSRVNRFKGQSEVLEALTPLLRETDNLYLLFVGDASDDDMEYFVELKSRAERVSQNRIIFAGYQVDPVPFFAACDIVVHGSIGTEGFGRTIVEAMYAKRPVVATANGGPVEIVEHGRTGFLVHDNRFDELADYVRRLFTNRRLREQLGENAFKVAQRKYSQEIVASQLSTVLRGAAEETNTDSH